MLTGKHVVLGVTGGIAAYKACEVVSRLRKLHAEVDGDQGGQLSQRYLIGVLKEYKQQWQEIHRNCLHDITDKARGQGVLIGQLHCCHLLSFSGRL